jgi:hypothetical protein
VLFLYLLLVEGVEVGKTIVVQGALLVVTVDQVVEEIDILLVQEELELLGKGIMAELGLLV